MNRIGSLFTGTGALDLAVMDVFDAEVVWHSQYEPPDKNGKEDKNQYAAKILARHWPDVPNLGDVTKVDWPAVLDEHGPIDILTGGFPCQDVSSAGKRAGLTADSRSGLWAHFARAIHELRPRLVVIENVEGLLSAEADRGLGLDAEALDEEARAGRVLRALGAVLGDLATLGFDAEWCRVAASEVGAPHPRKRVFIYAWPAALDAGGVGRGDGSRVLGLLGAEGRDAQVAADAADLGHERAGHTRRRGHGPSDGRVAAADAAGHAGRIGYRDDVHPGCRADGRGSAAGRGEAAADASRILPGHDGKLSAGRDAVQRGVRDDAPRCSPAPSDANSERDGEEHQGPHLVHGERAEDGWRAVQLPGPDGDREAGDRGTAREPASERGAAAQQQADRRTVLDLRDGDAELDWGDYGPAIRRWEAVLGRPAPWPTDALGRLSPVFTEWLMGLPDGWVTDTPGLTRPAMLRALGNGVVRLQAATAIQLLAERAIADTHAQAA